MKNWHWIALGVLTVASLVVEQTLLGGKGKHWWDAIPGFYILWSFFGCVIIIYVSKWIGKVFLFRKEDYYDK